jgi:hypothetical protein
MADVSAPKLFKTIFEARFKPYLNFYSVFRTAAAKLTHYPHWATDSNTITLRNYDTRCSLAIHNGAFGFSQDSSDITNEEARLKEAVDTLIPELGLTTFRRLGFRRQYLVPLQITFESLVSILELKLLSGAEQLQQILPGEVNDLLYRLDYSESDDKFHIHLGPLRRQEVPKYINFEAENHLPAELREDLLRQILAGYPEVSMLIDIDYYQVSTDISVQAARDFIPKARRRLDELTRQFHEYVFSQQVK